MPSEPSRQVTLARFERPDDPAERVEAVAETAREHISENGRPSA